MRVIAASVRCAKNTVRRALHAHLRGPPKQLGRPRTLSLEDHVALCEAFQDDPYAGVAAVHEALMGRGLNMSLDTVRREMKRAIKAMKKRAVNRCCARHVAARFLSRAPAGTLKLPMHYSTCRWATVKASFLSWSRASSA